MSKSKDTIETLNEALNRLMLENGKLRRKVEEAQAVIRRRAPSADGLPLASALKTILDERDKTAKRIDFYRNQLKKVLKILLAGDVNEARKEINHFLFHNHE